MRYILTIIAAFWISSTFAAETKDFDAKDLKEIEIENSSGKVTVSGVDGTKAEIQSTKNKFDDRCTLTIEKSGGKIHLKVKSKWSLTTHECDVDFDIKTPKSTNLNAVLGSGSITVRAVQGAFSFILGSGDVSADGTFKEISGKDGSGDIDIKGLTENADIRSGSGNIKLTYARTPVTGALELKTGSGNATVLFPKGAKIKTSFKAGSGQIVNELGDTPGADFEVSMKAGSGNLNIKSY